MLKKLIRQEINKTINSFERRLSDRAYTYQVELLQQKINLLIDVLIEAEVLEKVEFDFDNGMIRTGLSSFARAKKKSK